MSTNEFLLESNPGGIQSEILSSLGNGFEHKMEHTVRIRFSYSFDFAFEFSIDWSLQMILVKLISSISLNFM